ncbi:MAG: HEAT repeat domain-containing protein [Pirellulaceae bacterium]
MSEEKALTYRGDIRGIAATGKTIAWVTQHPQKSPTSVYRLDGETMALEEAALPAGAISILAADKGFWVGGDDSRLYQITANAKKPKSLADLPSPATKIVSLAGKQLAALCDASLVVLDAAKGEILQTIELPDRGTSLAADPTGDWIAIGMHDGTIAVFDREEKDAFLLSESEKIHNGAVTALLFETDELRFFSAGADKKLFSTHARGRLEAEDRGRANTHSERVTSMLLVPGDRFISGSRDKTCKTWARAGATKPATQSDGIAAVVDMALCQIHGRSQLAIACSDNSIRFFLIDAGGRFGAMTHRITDAYSRAKQLLQHNDAATRGEGMTALADYDDIRSVEMLAAHIDVEHDHKLRVRAAELLSKSPCPLAGKLLQPLLKVKDMVVRETAFAGLCERAADGDLEPLKLALDSGHHNVGTLAIASLAKVAAKDEIASQLIVASIDHKLPEVRIAAQLNLESILAADSPQANLTAIASKQPDSRVLGLVRLYQRKMLSVPRVQAAIRRTYEDKDAAVRQHAFLVSVSAKEKLTAAIRFRSEDLHRQFFSLESIGAKLDWEKSKSKDLPKAKKASADLPPDELDPLLTAMASRATDTALRGATCLALLGDARSLGMLLQLSREEDDRMRGEVCRALSELGDSRATDRLETMLDDNAETVRDAAFTAFAKLTESDQLKASASGLSSTHADVRRRALQSLVAFIRKSAKNKKDDRGRELLVRALNDSEAAVRNEAFKATLNLQINGGDDATLRFVLGSVHADIRREVLTEVIANEKEDWATALLHDLFSDPDSGIRSEAFEHAINKTKKRDIDPMRFGLQSAYPDIRLSATKYLIGLATPASQELLATTVNDDDKDVRQAALNAIVDQSAADVLKSSLQSKHDDVRLRVASALASVYGDPICLQPLLDFATADEPEDSEDKTRWKQSVLSALVGLSDLGDSSIADAIRPLLKHTDGEIRAAATAVFADFLDQSAADTLSEMMRDSDANVQVRAAVGLAVCGDTKAMPIVHRTLASGGSLEFTQVVAAVVYDDVAETRLIALLDHDQDWVANVALLTLLSRDLLKHDGTPRRSIACLSAQSPRARLIAARAVEAFGDDAAFQTVLVNLANDRGESDGWEISSETVRSIASTLVFASSPIRERLIFHLSALDSPKQETWDQQWGFFSNRFADQISVAEKETAKLPKVTADKDELTNIAFGSYVGLIREQGGYHHRGNRPAFGATVIAIRETAMRRLIEITGDDPVLQASARPVLMQALGDPNQTVRMLAFKQLPSLGIDNEARAFAAIESGHVDLAVQGMQLLTSDAKIDTVRQVLTDVILSRADRLAVEAAGLLAEKTSRVEAAEIALESPSASLRNEAIRWLVQDYDESKKAPKLLREALESKYQRVRHNAAIGLADKKDPNAFDALVNLLQSGDATTQHSNYELEEAFRKLGDPRATDAALDRIENDPEETARVVELFQLVGEFRLPQNVDRLLTMMENKKWRIHASTALLSISGFDQPIDDPFDDREDRSWLSKQHPRHDDVLAKLIDRHVELETSPRHLVQWIEHGARWSQSDAVDDTLSRLVTHADETLRRTTVAAIGWRLKHRDGSADPLLAALESKDPDTKFLAAEGLARAGRDDGIAVLMSAVELLSDLRSRARAVTALGELADPRALDLLLRLAADDQHALQHAAAFAIGHLSETDRAEEIFAILKRLVLTPSTSTHNALLGLRHFASADAWQLLRDHAKKAGPYQEVALVQLSYNDDPATKDLYLELLGGDSFYGDALHAARRLFGEDSLLPDYAVLGADFWYDLDLESEYRCVQRVGEGGDAERILKLLPKCNDDVAEVLSANLLKRDPLPVEGAVAALESPHPATIALAAHIIGRAGEKSGGDSIQAALVKTLSRWNDTYDHWRERRVWTEELEPINKSLEKLCWAASRTQSAKSELIDIVHAHVDKRPFATVRHAAINALAERKLTKTDIGKLKTLVDDNDANIRRRAAELVVANDAQSESQSEAIADAALSDRNVFRSVVAAGADIEPMITKAISQPNQQAIVLPSAIRHSDVDTLFATARDTEATDMTRLGAIEGLGQIANAASLQHLATIGTDESTDEELRKAAWRSYRRSKRIQAKAQLQEQAQLQENAQ